MTPAGGDLGAAGHGMAAPRGQDAPADGRWGRFGRLFPAGPKPDTRAIEALVDWIAFLSQTHTDNVDIPAGYTYLGQFIDHDITFDPLSKLESDNDPQALVNFRTPRYDLDSVYGSGPQDQPFLYEWENRADRGVTLVVGDTDGAPDLPRNKQGIALIGDARNDENLIVSQLHLLFIRFHNRVVNHLRKPGVDAAIRFEEARQLVVWHYQWIVVHDFLPLIVGDDVLKSVLRPGPSPDAPPTVERRFYRSEDGPFIPVEFSGAAYRFGHSMVRPSYFMTKTKQASIFPAPGTEPSDDDLSGFRPLPAALRIDWDRFFFEPPETNPDGHKRNNSLRINGRISPQLFAVPNRGKLPRLNMLRGRALELASGQQVADAMQKILAPARPLQLSDEELQLDPDDTAGMNDRLLEATPLWYYLLAEANKRENGKRLGPMGGRIVAEVLIGLLEADKGSYLSEEPAWRPTLPSVTKGDFTMIDLVNFALGRKPVSPQP